MLLPHDPPPQAQVALTVIHAKQATAVENLLKRLEEAQVACLRYRCSTIAYLELPKNTMQMTLGGSHGN